MNKKALEESIIIKVCFCVLFFFLFSIAIRYITRQVLIVKLGINNSFTRIVWFDNSTMWDKENQNDDITLDWESMYPFENADVDMQANNNLKSIKIVSFYNNLVDRFSNIKKRIEAYTSDYIVSHSQIIYLAQLYKKIIGWNFSPYSEYNGVVSLENGYLVDFIEKKFSEEQVNTVKSFYEFSSEEKIPFLYVQAPYKISKYDDINISGVVDFSNQNADNFLNSLIEDDIPVLDLRERIKKEDISHKNFFYRTDHHWLTTSGLWAAQQILSYVSNQYGWEIDSHRLDSDKFHYETYSNWFLGSQGKKVTLARCLPDDFTLLFPQEKAEIHYIVPQMQIDAISDYSLIYNMDYISEKNYFELNPYEGYNYGDQALIEIENMGAVDAHKILFIHDSFGNCVSSNLVLAEKNVISLDLRHFTGSVERFVKESKPDLIIVMYNVGFIGEKVDFSTHRDAFDFR